MLGIGAHARPHLAPCLDVQSGGGLVQDEQVGRTRHRYREPDALRLPARQLIGPSPGQVRDVRGLHQLRQRRDGPARAFAA